MSTWRGLLFEDWCGWDLLSQSNLIAVEREIELKESMEIQVYDELVWPKLNELLWSISWFIYFMRTLSKLRVAVLC